MVSFERYDHLFIKIKALYNKTKPLFTSVRDNELYLKAL